MNIRVVNSGNEKFESSAIDLKKQNAVICSDGHMVAISSDEVRIAHTEEVLVLQGCCSRRISPLKLLDVAVAENV